MKRNVEVIADFDFFSKPKTVGTMAIDNSGFKPVVSFSFDPDWNQYDFASLIPQTPGLEKNYGFLFDSSPDRWGRLLIQRFRNNAKSLTEHDFLFAIDDYLRSGALRFKEDGKFLSSEVPSVPPLESLGKLEQLCIDYQNNNISDEIRFLVKPGSSLGGARPKANVVDNKGNLWIAKFPSKNDVYDVGLWEYLLCKAAKNCGIDVPETKVIKSSLSNGHVFLSKRFDRNGKKRVHICTVYNLLGIMTDSDDSTFFDVLEAIERFSCRPKQDKEELYKRLVFSCLSNNTDNHLRNHSMLLSETGWVMSPAYDMNITTDSDRSVLAVDFNSHEFNKDVIIDVAPYYGIKKDQAANLFTSMSIQLSLLSELALNAGISKTEVVDVVSCLNN